jgi:hypothetical protein
MPHGEPFSLSNIYDAQPVFSEKFRRTFREQFALAETTPFFDVYAAKEDHERLNGVARVDRSRSAPRSWNIAR